MTHGLLPRTRLKIPSNYKGTYKSFADRVYLTDSYAATFAINSYPSGKLGKYLLLCEVDADKLDQSLMQSDEDYIAQYVAAVEEKKLEQTHKEVCRVIDHCQDFWRDSLKHLGTCAYQGAVPVRRVAIIEWKLQRRLCAIAVKAKVSIPHHSLHRRKFQSLMQWFFGDRSDIVQPYMSELDRAMWKEVCACRNGIKIIQCDSQKIDATICNGVDLLSIES